MIDRGTSQIRLWLMIAAGVLLLLTGAGADIITADGYNTDWESGGVDYAGADTVNNDGDEDLDNDGDSSEDDAYDIEYNYFEQDRTNGRLAFAYTTMDPLQDPGAEKWTAIYINADCDVNTGHAGTDAKYGAEYKLRWNLKDPDTQWSTLELYEYNDSQDQYYEVDNPEYIAVHAGKYVDGANSPSDFVEWVMDWNDIGKPSKFYWGAYIDNGGGPEDDFCPDEFDQDGYTPEPATTALFLLGLLALAGWVHCRRSDSEASDTA